MWKKEIMKFKTPKGIVEVEVEVGTETGIIRSIGEIRKVEKEKEEK